MCLLFQQGELAPFTVEWLAEDTQVREMQVLAQILLPKERGNTFALLFFSSFSIIFLQDTLVLDKNVRSVILT